FQCPPSLLAGRLVFELNGSPGLAKTAGNFAALCTGEKGACKNAPKKQLWYKGCPVHRIVKGYVVQGGDITRGDGSGGESIYGGKFNDEKDGLKIKPGLGSLAMANSGKNSNTSQFFVISTDAEAQLAKINGKYVVFGQLVDGWEVLQRLDSIGTGDGTPHEPVWIEDCG
ncbi:cyclophilin-like domain-containing protein, partial [Mycena sp. CBHHK59/15]